MDRGINTSRGYGITHMGKIKTNNNEKKTPQENQTREHKQYKVNPM